MCLHHQRTPFYIISNNRARLILIELRVDLAYLRGWREPLPAHLGVQFLENNRAGGFYVILIHLVQYGHEDLAARFPDRRGDVAAV